MIAAAISGMTYAAAVLVAGALVRAHYTRRRAEAVELAALRAERAMLRRALRSPLPMRRWFGRDALDRALMREVTAEVDRIDRALGEHPEPLTRAAMLLVAIREEPFSVEGDGPGVRLLARIVAVARRRGGVPR